MKKIKIRSKKRVIIHEQWIEIHTRHGKTVMTYYPSNEEFERLRLEMDPPAELIYRRLNFFGGFPPAFSWTDPPPESRLYGGQFLQRILVEEWPEIMKWEAEHPGEYRQPKRPQGRPAQFGPCPCAECQANPNRFDEYDQAA